MKTKRQAKIVEIISNSNVETQEQLDYLLPRNDCSYIQGYYFAKPLPKDDFEAYLQ